MVEFDTTNRFKQCLIDSNEDKKSLIAIGGDSNQIEFVYLKQCASESINTPKTNDTEQVDTSAMARQPASTPTLTTSDSQTEHEQSLSSLKIERVESLKISHGFKINCLKYAPTSATLYVSDTTRNLTIYDFNDS